MAVFSFLIVEKGKKTEYRIDRMDIEANHGPEKTY